MAIFWQEDLVISRVLATLSTMAFAWIGLEGLASAPRVFKNPGLADIWQKCALHVAVFFSTLALSHFSLRMWAVALCSQVAFRRGFRAVPCNCELHPVLIILPSGLWLLRLMWICEIELLASCMFIAGLQTLACLSSLFFFNFFLFLGGVHLCSLSLLLSFFFSFFCLLLSSRYCSFSLIKLVLLPLSLQMWAAFFLFLLLIGLQLWSKLALPHLSLRMWDVALCFFLFFLLILLFVSLSSLLFYLALTFLTLFSLSLSFSFFLFFLFESLSVFPSPSFLYFSLSPVSFSVFFL